MSKAIWQGVTLAESEHCEVVEGNYYFPPDSLQEEYLEPSTTNSTCPWKGTASYFNIVVDGQKNQDAAWYYPDTTAKAKHFQGYVAFWKGVTVEA